MRRFSFLSTSTKEAVLVSCFFFSLFMSLRETRAQDLDSALDGPKDFEIDRVEQLLQSYKKNRQQLSRYAVAMRIEQTILDNRNPDNSSADDIWQMQCFDRSTGTRRDDSIGVIESSRLGKRERLTTLFADTKGFLQVSGSRGAARKLDGTFENVENAEKTLRLQEPQMVVNPWDIALGNATGMRLHSNALINDVGNFEEFLLKMQVVKVVDVQDVINMPVSFRLLASAKSQIFIDLTLSRSEGMPTIVNTVSLEPGYSGLMNSVRTKWGSRPSGGYFPKQLTANMLLGPPAKPSKSMEWKIECTWLFGDDVPSIVFDREKLLTPQEVRDSIVNDANSISGTK